MQESFWWRSFQSRQGTTGRSHWQGENALQLPVAARTPIGHQAAPARSRAQGRLGLLESPRAAKFLDFYSFWKGRVEKWMKNDGKRRAQVQQELLVQCDAMAQEAIARNTGRYTALVGGGC